MKKAFRILAGLLFALAYPFACISAPYDSSLKGILWDYFTQRGTVFTLTRLIILFFAMFIITYLNRVNLKFLCIYIPIIMQLITAASVIDRFHTYHLFYNYYIILWFGVTIGVVNAAVFLCITLFVKDGYETFLRVFCLSLSLFYFFLLYVCFIRHPGAFEYSVNTHLGRGTTRFFRYVIKHPSDTYVGLVCVGNIFIFTPLPFIIRSIAPKLKKLWILLISLCISPFAEVYQYIYKCGNVDIDDLVLNWSGVLLGVLLILILEKYKLQQKNNAVRA